MNGFKTTRWDAIMGVLAVTAMLVTGCAGANRGGLRNSREVGRAFETFHVDPNHRYWYYNQENNPYAVVGLQQPYRLEDINCREVRARPGLVRP